MLFHFYSFFLFDLLKCFNIWRYIRILFQRRFKLMMQKKYPALCVNCPKDPEMKSIFRICLVFIKNDTLGEFDPFCNCFSTIDEFSKFIKKLLIEVLSSSKKDYFYIYLSYKAFALIFHVRPQYWNQNHKHFIFKQLQNFQNQFPAKIWQSS